MNLATAFTSAEARVRTLAITVILVSLAVIVPVLGLQLSFLITQTSAHETSLAGDAHIILMGTGHELGRLARLTEEAQGRLVGTSQNTNALLIQLGLAADQWRLASMDSSAISEQTKKLIANTNYSLNHPREGLIPAATIAVIDTSRSANTLLASTERQVNDTAYETKRLLGLAQTNLELLNSQTMPKANAVLDSTNGAINDLRPGIRSSSEAAESVNQGLAPLRKKAGRFVTALKLIGTYLKATVKVW